MDKFCQECGALLIFDGGCFFCPLCGWSKCGYSLLDEAFSLRAEGLPSLFGPGESQGFIFLNKYDIMQAG